MKILKFQQPASGFPNVFRTANGQYVNEKDEPLTVVTQLGDDESKWTYKDAKGNIYTPKFKTTQAELREAENVNPIVNTINQYFREGKYTLNNNKVPTFKYSAPIVLLGGATGGAAIQAPLAFLSSMGGAYVGEKAVDYSTKLATGKSWAENIHNWTGLDKEPAVMTNPGAFIGGTIGGTLVPRRARAAVYNNITPLAYNSISLKGIPINKHKEIGNTIKQFFSFKRINPNTDNPTWLQKIKNNPNYNPEIGLGMNNYDGSTTNVLKIKDMLDFRNQAWARAMRQKAPNHKLYIDNGDGTVRYNMDYVNDRLFKWNPHTQTYVGKGWNGKIGSNIRMKYFDSITGNGGGVGIINTPNGQQYMIDTWDLQPFVDEYRSLSPWVTKNIPFMRKFEAVSFLGGNPFKLKQPIPTQSKFFTTNYIK